MMLTPTLYMLQIYDRVLISGSQLTLLAVSLHGQQSTPGQPSAQSDGFRFKSGVELINVTATVLDATGRFVAGLRLEDFRVMKTISRSR